MDISLWLELTLFVILTGLSGFFSSAGTSLFSRSKNQLQQLRRDGNASPGRIERLLSQPLHAGNTFLKRFIRVPIPMLVGEVMPKYPAIGNSLAFAAFQSGNLAQFADLIAPLRWLVRLAANRVATRVFGKELTRTSGQVRVKW